MPFQVTKDPVLRACCIPVCNNQKFNLTHKFPGNEAKCDEWLLALDEPKLYLIPKQKLIRSHFICTRHFRDEDYKFPTSRHLNSNAVPNLNIKNFNDLHLVSSRWKDESNKVEKTLNEDENFEDSIFSDHTIQHIEINIAKNEDNFTESDEEIVETESDLGIDNNSVPECSSKKFPLKSRLRSLDNLLVQTKRMKLDLDFESKKNLLRYVDDDNSEEQHIICIKDDEEEEYEISNEESSQEEINEHLSTLKISHPNYGETIEVNLFWLRDHCKCESCYNFETFQRKTNILDIPLEIAILQTEFRDKKIYVKWEDEHESEYDLDVLYKSQSNENAVNDFVEFFLWDKRKIEITENNYTESNFGEFLSDDNLAKKVVSSIVKFGFAFIKNVPPTTDMTELTIKRLFPIQKTLFGEMWTFTNNKDRADTAYTNEYLGPHNDNTYFCDAAGLQVFHCIKKKGNGGNSILVDGFKAAQELELEDPDCFHTLSTVNVPAEYIEKDQHHKYSAPIIILDSKTREPKQIRFNLYDRSDFNEIERKDVRNFYKSLKKFTQIVNNKKNIFEFQLEPGTVVIFDNWRVLHGRTQFSGERVMTGCYISRTDFMSKARIMGLVE